MIVVVVDDEEGVRRSVKRVLERDGYGVVAVEDGERALGVVRERSGDIETVISDYKMPGMDGLETLIAIGRINPEITRIMLTGYATMESAIEAVNAGIDGFLTKPFDNLELRAKVREYNVKKRLKQFVSEPVLMELQKDRSALMPRRLTASILFCDIRDFSALASTVAPGELAELLNRFYFSPLDRIIYEHQGTLDKHIGDGIMGIFGAPVSGEDDALRAVRCALEMREAMTGWNEARGGLERELSIGIGIATGEVMAGVFGSPMKKEYTAFGHAVNLASRLEHLAGGGQVLICPETYERVKGRVEAKREETPPIKGLNERVEVYSVLGLK
ncbi:MAG TPA: adenylate/guanylate cyclase domain-containing protein [Syntrophales bacterium]|nr:adenylate/guanylate cyclase domain-containing protein [Syntrophales bacterium]